MFMVSFRLSAKRVLVGLTALVVVTGLGFFGFRTLRGNDQMTSANAVSAQEQKAEKIKPKKIKTKNNEERLAFMKSYGWDVQEDPVEVAEVIIPKEFDAVYTDYNALQKLQGFDLESYAGKRCKRYSYHVLNYPDPDCDVEINLLLYGDKLIGGDVHSTLQGGFLHGFDISQK